MTTESTQPYTGPAVIDLTEIAPLLVDLVPSAMRGLRREQPGMTGVISELRSSVPTLGAKAAISSDVYASFEQNLSRIEKVRIARAILDKLAEVLEESEAYYEDQREGDISLIATAVRTSARRKDKSIRAAFQKTLTYNAQAATKAAKTRRKNAKAESEAEATAEEEGEEAGDEVKDKALEGEEAPSSEEEEPAPAKGPSPRTP